MRVLALLGLLLAAPAFAEPASPTSGTETVSQAMCRLIEGAAPARKIPVAFLTRLIWRESSFRAGAVSSAGARGVAQFMPGTAAERRLADPFDPEQAIPEAAAFLDELRTRFGSLGLAAAAYNAGPGRVAAWLDGRGGLPEETRTYVARITGRSADDWAEDKRQGHAETPPVDEPCLVALAVLRRPGRETLPAEEAPIAPWGVQLAGNFSKDRALAAFARTRQLYAGLLGEARPMIIGTRLRSRGTRAFYRVRVPVPSRKEAEALCTRLRGAGGACVVLPS
ncbi:MAG TPA: lytic transglycosylase domain-containing protein [Beijerinckiaceae bacterium]|jgi:hypothetical protein